MNLKKALFAPALMALCLAGACSSSSKPGVALDGTLHADSVQDFMMTYYVDGNMLDFKSIELKPDGRGHFEVSDSLIPAGGTRAQLMADNVGYFGVWLESGKTTVVDITRQPDGSMAIAFSGDNREVNELVNAMTQGYDLMKFSPQDPSERLPYDEAMALLEKTRADINGRIAALKDEKTRESYQALSDAQWARMKCIIIEDKAYDSDSEPTADPEYMKLIESIDPNSDAALESGMCFLWINNSVKAEGSEAEQSIARLAAVDSKITNPKTRKALYQMIPHTFFSYTKPSPEDAQAFLKVYAEKAKDYPEFIDHFTLQAAGIREIKAGDALGYDPTIVDPQGKQCKLSDLFGEVLYIDFWATWCGPCCRQIPHMEKLVENMKDARGIRFVSISCDSDVDAWKAKLAKDKPEWPQYIFAPGEGDKFMQVENITGIPRFMLLAPDGKTIAPEAPLPSDSKTETYLRSNL